MKFNKETLELEPEQAVIELLPGKKMELQNSKILIYQNPEGNIKV